MVTGGEVTPCWNGVDGDSAAFAGRSICIGSCKDGVAAGVPDLALECAEISLSVWPTYAMTKNRILTER